MAHNVLSNRSMRVETSSRLRHAAPPPAGAGPVGSAGGDDQRSRDGTGLHVLLVEDDAGTATAMAALLRLWGHRPSVALDRRSALALAHDAHRRGSGFDLVLSDIQLPDGTGWDLMAELRTRFGLHGIALTGCEGPEDRQRSRDAGFSDHLLKPVDLRCLQTALELAGAPGR